MKKLFINPKKIVIVGTISNVSKVISRDLKKLNKSFRDFEIIKIILVESDSFDSTLEVLDAIKQSNMKLEIISLGNLKQFIPNRIERIRHCRNIYVERLRDLLALQVIDYVVVADLDGMNRNLKASSILSCFKREDWAGVIANQTFGYYDILALRCKSWVTEDCFQVLAALKKSLASKAKSLNRFELFFAYDKCRYEAIYRHMIKIPKDSDWIRVEAGFGGLGIYRAELFKQVDYSEKFTPASIRSEHLAFCEQVSGLGGQIYINPKLINNHINTYNINRIGIIRIVRSLFWKLK